MDDKFEVHKWIVPAEDCGIRLDKFVAQRGGVSRRVARIWISTGRVEVKGKPLRILTRPLRRGTSVVLSPQKRTDTPTIKEASDLPELEIILLSRDVVVVNKPANLLSESDRFGAPSVETVLPKLLEKRSEPNRLWLVHRLDAGTTGVLVLARTAKAARSLNAAFREGRVEKTYVALVKGYLRKGIHIDAPIARIKGTKHGVKSGGKPSHTHAAPLSATKSASLVRARPTTGRTHQIRVHLASVDLPLYGDRLYGGPGYTEEMPPNPVSRAMLHAMELRFPDPRDESESIVVNAPLPRDFLELASTLGLEAKQ